MIERKRGLVVYIHVSNKDLSKIINPLDSIVAKTEDKP